MYRLNQSQPHGNYKANAMETDTIQKNGARPKSYTSRRNVLNVHSRIFLFILIIVATCSFNEVKAQNGYIMQITGNNYYLKIPNVKTSDILSVFSSIKDPKTGQDIEIPVGQLQVKSVSSEYVIAKAYGEATTELVPEMVVRIDKKQQSEISFMIAPTDMNFPKGMNYKVEDGFIGDYVSAALMPHILNSPKIQLISSSLLADGQNKSGNTYYHHAVEYAKSKNVRYMVKITMTKPDVESIQKSVDAKNTIGFILGIGGGGKTTPNVPKYVPGKTDLTNITVTVKMVVNIIDLQTDSDVRDAYWRAMGTASGKPSVQLTDWKAFGDLQIQQGNFTQTVTGQAIDNTFEQIGPKLNDFINSNL
jgi:hypothetical protein